MCRLMQMIILTLKICAKDIAQQNDNNLEGDVNFFGWRSQCQEWSFLESQSLWTFESLTFSPYIMLLATNLLLYYFCIHVQLVTKFNDQAIQFALFWFVTFYFLASWWSSDYVYNFKFVSLFCFFICLTTSPKPTMFCVLDDQ
jgi:hypothetical protein